MNTKSKKQLFLSLILPPILLCVGLEIFYKLSNMNHAKYPSIISHFFDIGLFMLIYFLLVAMIKKTFPCTVTLAILTFVLGLVNQLKIAYSADPVFLTDISFVQTPGTFTDIMDGTIGGILLKLWWTLSIFLIFLIGTCILSYQNQWEASKNFRITSLIAIACFFITLFASTKEKDFLADHLFIASEEKNNNTTSNMRYYYQHGVLSGMYGQYITTQLKEPAGYQAKQLDETMQKTLSETPHPKKKFGKPNIVMVFSESFWNPDQLADDVVFNQPVAKNFEDLSKKGLLLNVISPAFGGTSCNPEFEMLTSGSLKFFPDGFIPYMNLYSDSQYSHAPSVIQELNKNGYKTHITSCWDDSLFNSQKVYQYMGVDQTDFENNLKNIQFAGGRISDDYIADRIIKELQTKDQQPLFTMTLTAEAHMPYYKNKFKNYDITIEKSPLTSDQNDILRSYAQGIYDADKQLKKIYDYIQTMKEPTILIFYGDHLPYLKQDDGFDLYSKFSYFNTGDDKTDTFRKYNTQCLILDNFNAKYDKIQYLGFDLVMPYLLNHMDLQLSDYYKWIYTTAKDLPCGNQKIFADTKGNLYTRSELPDSMKKAFTIREQANWKFFCFQ